MDALVAAPLVDVLEYLVAKELLHGLPAFGLAHLGAHLSVLLF